MKFSKYKLLTICIVFTALTTFSIAQEKEKQIIVPPFIIFNKFTNKESYKLIRWVSWTEDQKLKIFMYAKEFGDKEQRIPSDVAAEVNKIKNSLVTEEQKKEFDEKEKTGELTKSALEKHQKESVAKVQQFIESLLTEEQKKEFSEKTQNAELAKVAMEKTLEDFDKKTVELKGAPFNQDLYDIMNATRFFYFPETWAITRTPISKDEMTQIMNLISYLQQIEQGFFLAIEKNQQDLNKNYNLFDFNLKKDYGTEALVKEIKSFSKPSQEIFSNLLNHYVSQKKEILSIYSKYGDKTKFQIPLAPPKIMDAQ